MNTVAVNRLEFLEQEFRQAGRRLAEEIAREFPVGALIWVHNVFRATIIRTPEEMCPTLMLVRPVSDDSQVTFANWKDCGRVPN